MIIWEHCCHQMLKKVIVLIQCCYQHHYLSVWLVQYKTRTMYMGSRQCKTFLKQWRTRRNKIRTMLSSIESLTSAKQMEPKLFMEGISSVNQNLCGVPEKHSQMCQKLVKFQTNNSGQSIKSLLNTTNVKQKNNQEKRKATDQSTAASL